MDDPGPMVENRAGPHLVLAILTVLALGAVWLSLVTAPDDAQQAVQVAARNTAAASSLVLSDTVAVVSSQNPRSEVPQQTVHVVYRAPDKVLETATLRGRSLQLLVLGDARYERSGNGPWLSLGPQDNAVPVGTAAAAGVLAPIQALTSVTRAVRQGSRYTFEPAQRGLVLDELLGAHGDQLTPAATSFEATVAGEFLSSFTLRARGPGSQVVVRLKIDSVDHAPTLVAPSVPGR